MPMSTGKKKAGGGFQSFGKMRLLKKKYKSLSNRTEFNSVQGCYEERIPVAYTNSTKSKLVLSCCVILCFA